MSYEYRIVMVGMHDLQKVLDRYSSDGWRLISSNVSRLALAGTRVHMTIGKFDVEGLSGCHIDRAPKHPPCFVTDEGEAAGENVLIAERGQQLALVAKGDAIATEPRALNAKRRRCGSTASWRRHGAILLRRASASSRRWRSATG